MTTSGSAAVTLPADDQILITREFDAPKHLVYKAFTTPELVKRWWHAKRGEVTIAEIDLRVGGTWRYLAVTSEDGFEVGFHGEYREIVPNERIVSTETYEGLPEGVSEEDGTTVNTATSPRPMGAQPSRSSCRLRARRPATRSSTPAWKPGCRTRWTSWKRSQSRSAEQ